MLLQTDIKSPRFDLGKTHSTTAISEKPLQQLTQRPKSNMSSSSSPLLASSVPRIGVAVFVLHPCPLNPQSIPTNAPNTQYKFILGQRLGSHGASTWALPGGHLEFGESFEECAKREVLEETDLELEDVHFLTATNDVFSVEGKHYITVFVTARVKGQGSGV